MSENQKKSMKELQAEFTRNFRNFFIARVADDASWEHFEPSSPIEIFSTNSLFNIDTPMIDPKKFEDNVKRQKLEQMEPLLVKMSKMSADATFIKASGERETMKFDTLHIFKNILQMIVNDENLDVADNIKVLRGNIRDMILSGEETPISKRNLYALDGMLKDAMNFTGDDKFNNFEFFIQFASKYKELDSEISKVLCVETVAGLDKKFAVHELICKTATEKEKVDSFIIKSRQYKSGELSPELLETFIKDGAAEVKPNTLVRTISRNNENLGVVNILTTIEEKILEYTKQNIEAMNNIQIQMNDIAAMPTGKDTVSERIESNKTLHESKIENNVLNYVIKNLNDFKQLITDTVERDGMEKALETAKKVREELGLMEKGIDSMKELGEYNRENPLTMSDYSMSDFQSREWQRKMRPLTDTEKADLKLSKILKEHSNDKQVQTPENAPVTKDMMNL